MINQGAAYLYTDSKKITATPEIKPYLDKVLFNKGSIVVYSLKIPSP